MTKRGRSYPLHSQGPCLTLSKVKIPRCYKPVHFGEAKSVELHTFLDASTLGYGQCSYLRMINGEDKIHCALVMAKSRVTPSRPVTIPRLELTAALLSVKISTFLKKERKYDAISEVFWTDSEVARGYISNDAKRFHIFVTDRVQQIRDYTSAEQWRKISTKENPADDASRRISAQELIDSPGWWKGPEMLWKPLDDRTGREEPAIISDSDPGVRRVLSFATKTNPFAGFLERLQYFSDWPQAKRAVALCLCLQRRFKKNAMNKSPPEKTTNHLEPVNIKEIRSAEIEIIRAVQLEAFQRELTQKMANLPEDRVRASPPFTYRAVDYFGPFYIKEGQRKLKRYWVLFTCIASRAIHLETATLTV